MENLEYSLSEELERERKELFDLLAVNRTEKYSFINGDALANDHNQNLISFYKDNIYPLIKNSDDLGREHGIHDLLLALGLYHSENEKKEWDKKVKQARESLNKLKSSEIYKQAFVQFRELAQKTAQGDFSKWAVHISDRELMSLPDSDLLALWDEIKNIEGKVFSASRQLPLSKSRPQYFREVGQIKKNFKEGEVSFEDAWQKYEELEPISSRAFAHSFVDEVRDELNRLAILRTKVAKHKGYKNWAEYTVTLQQNEYSDPFTTVSDRIKFLVSTLEKTAPVLKELVGELYENTTGVGSFNSARRSHLNFIFPDAEALLREYFPKENIPLLWKKTMREIGFSSDAIESIMLDAYPRERKYNHAFCMCTSTPFSKNTTINSKTLNVVERDSWRRGKTTIVQNILGDGLPGIKTLFHEGGHGLECCHAEPGLIEISPYAYAEVNSTLLEKIILDKDFLLDNGINKEGKRIPKILVEEYLSGKKNDELYRIVGTCGSALYDLMIWDYDYSEDSVSFIDKCEMTMRDNINKYEPIKYGCEVSDVNPYFSHFSTPHLYSGRLIYIGYVLADIAVELSREKLLDEFESETGRRSLYKQESLASKLINGYYKKGLSYKFPESVERFTGEKFDSDKYTEKVLHWINEKNIL